MPAPSPHSGETDTSPPAGAAQQQLAGIPRADIVSVSELLIRLVLASRALERIRPPRGPDLSPHAVRATMHLFQHGQGTVGDLADGLGVSMGWASRIADELERTGHVLRERDALDRRVVRLRLSTTATGIAEGMYRERGRAVAEALASVGAEERRAVERFLRRLIDGLEALSDSPASPPEA